MPSVNIMQPTNADFIEDLPYSLVSALKRYQKHFPDGEFEFYLINYDASSIRSKAIRANQTSKIDKYAFLLFLL